MNRQRDKFTNETKTHLNENLMSRTLNNLTTSTIPNAENKIKEKLNDMEPVLSDTQLKNLDSHKYSSLGTTLLDPLFQPYWRWLVEQMPLNVAPNLLTIIGLIINVVTSTIFIILSPNGDQDLPKWSLFLCGIGLFVYQSLDAIDGKQARRTNSSSPLGELFDHGCDAISTVFVMLAFSVCFKFGNDPWTMFIINFVAMSTFYTAHWQTYVTGTLKFGKIDVTEAQLTIYLIYLFNSLFGDSMWYLEIPIFNIQLRYLPIIVAILGSTYSLFDNFNTISKGGKGKNGSSVADTSIVFPIFPLLLFLFLAFSIANKSETIYFKNTCLYTLAFGIVWSKMTIKLIIAHMTKGEIYLLDSCLIGPILLLLNQYFSNIIPELVVLYFCLLIATVDLLKYCSKVCYQICNHMNIYLFKIKAPSGPAQDSTRNKNH